MVFINGVLVAYIKVTSKKDLDVVKENGKNQSMKVILINLKEFMLMIRKMGKECLNGKMGLYIKETIKIIKDMAMVRCIGPMAPFIKVNGKMVNKAETE